MLRCGRPAQPPRRARTPGELMNLLLNSASCFSSSTSSSSPLTLRPLSARSTAAQKSAASAAGPRRSNISITEWGAAGRAPEHSGTSGRTAAVFWAPPLSPPGKLWPSGVFQRGTSDVTSDGDAAAVRCAFLPLRAVSTGGEPPLYLDSNQRRTAAWSHTSSVCTSEKFARLLQNTFRKFSNFGALNTHLFFLLFSPQFYHVDQFLWVLRLFGVSKNEYGWSKLKFISKK